MTFTILYSGIRFSTAVANEWDAVTEFTNMLRRVRRDIYDALRFGRSASPSISINGKPFEVVGTNIDGSRIAYREKRREDDAS